MSTLVRLVLTLFAGVGVDAPVAAAMVGVNSVTAPANAKGNFDLTTGTRFVGMRVDRGADGASTLEQTTFLVTTAADNGNNTAPIAGSLRAALKAANVSALPFRIIFDVSGPCPRIVNLAAPMPDITGDVTIDGRTQPGWVENSGYRAFDATLCIAVNGSGSTPFAFHVSSDAGAARLVVQGMIFAGFADAAIKLEGGADHRISGNQFGAVPFTSNNNDAIRVTGNSGGALIGGLGAGSVNLIAGSSNVGVYLDNDAGGSTLGNNVIGFQVNGNSNGGNGTGVSIVDSPDNDLLYNRIGYSAGNGVSISGAASTGNVMQYNGIGMTGNASPAGNQGAGVALWSGARNSTIGGALNGNSGGNEISHNVGPGVWISPTGGAGNRVLGNRFYFNGAIDIDLAHPGPSANQASNPTSGPNQLQNFPQLTLATRSSDASPVTSVTGILHSAASMSYQVDVYYAESCDNTAPSRGRADVHLGHSVVMTNAAGDATFSFSLEPPPPFALWLGFVSATATSVSGDTSEIGNCIQEVPSNLLNLMFSHGFE